ncbi:MAG: DUF6285 domain-containing protein [Myxococcota bacterium]
MVDQPDDPVLLDAIAALLGGDVVKAIADPALSFRVRIAAHLLGGIARELRTADADDRAHLDALRAMVAGVPDQPDDVRAAILDAERALAAALKSAPLTDADYARFARGLRSIVGARVTTGNPRFDLSDRIE